MFSFRQDVHEIAGKRAVIEVRGFHLGRRVYLAQSEPYQYARYLRSSYFHHSETATEPLQLFEAIKEDLAKIGLVPSFYTLDLEPLNYEEAAFFPCLLVADSEDPFYSVKDH